MRKKVLVFLAEGFEEIECITVVDILRRAGIEVVIAGLTASPIIGSRKISVMADQIIDEVSPKDFDMVVLPGGMPGTNNLEKDPRVISCLKEMDQQEKYIAAICAAPRVLKKAGLINQKSITSHPSLSDDFQESNYQEERVVVDGRLITSRSPGTSMEFAFQLVEILVGEKIAGEVNQGVLARLDCIQAKDSKM